MEQLYIKNTEKICPNKIKTYEKYINAILKTPNFEKWSGGDVQFTLAFAWKNNMPLEYIDFQQKVRTVFFRYLAWKTSKSKESSIIPNQWEESIKENDIIVD